MWKDAEYSGQCYNVNIIWYSLKYIDNKNTVSNEKIITDKLRKKKVINSDSTACFALGC